MKNKIGIRREDLSKEGERRVAVTPRLAKKIVEKGHELFVQAAHNPETGERKRAFNDQDYKEAGATLTEDLSNCDIIFGLKEVDKPRILPEKFYLFFSHTHKGQTKNREMLQKLVDQKNTVIDYELVETAGKGRVITAFTYYAGYAGMIDTLWTYGKRMKMRGISHQFGEVPQSIEKEDLGLIKKMLADLGEKIKSEGTPAELPPMINCILGKGKTSFGAQEIYDILPVESITPAQLKDTYENGDRKKVYKLVLEIDEMFRLKEDAPVDCEAYTNGPQKDRINLYFEHPEYFESHLDTILPYCSILMNCILWGPEFPRTLSRDLMASLWESGTSLEAIGDITCDPEGSIEFSKETWINDPVYIYHPEKRTQTDGFEGDGVAVMAVTNLPCEFSADASAQFSADFEPIVENLLDANLAGSLEEAGLVDEWKNAVILWKGEFPEKWAYMKEYLG